MVLMSLTIAGETFWDKMCKQGQQHDTKIKVKRYDNFGPTPDLSDVDCTPGAWAMEVYKLIYFQLKGGFWLNTLQTVKKLGLPIIDFFRRLDEHYFRCTVDTLREARKLLFTAEYNPKISISSWLLQFEAVMHNYVFEQDEHLGTNTPLTAAATWDLIYGAIRNSSVAFANILQSMMDEIRLHHDNKFPDGNDGWSLLEQFKMRLQECDDTLRKAGTLPRAHLATTHAFAAQIDPANLQGITPSQQEPMPPLYSPAPAPAPANLRQRHTANEDQRKQHQQERHQHNAPNVGNNTPDAVGQTERARKLYCRTCHALGA